MITNMINKNNVQEVISEIRKLKDIEEQRQALRYLCKTDLFFLSEGILRNLESEPIQLDYEYHGEMTEWLSRSGSRKMLLASRGTLKSTVGSRNYIIYRIINDPNITIMLVSATLDNSKKKLRAISEVFTRNDLFRWLFPELIPKSFNEQWTQTMITVPRTSTAAESTVEVQGYESELTSRHYDLIVDDDVVGKENSTTKDQILKVKNYYTQSLQLLKKPYGERLIIGTLWHYMDLYNHILENLYDDYDFYIRSCWKYDRYVKGNDGKWGWITTSDEIESVYPELMPVDKIYQIEKELTSDPLQGIATFKAQYEMKIVDEKNAIFPRQTYIDNKPFFTDDDLKDKKLAFSLSCDPAVSESKSADETAFVIRAMDAEGVWYLMEVFGQRGMREEHIVDKYVYFLKKYPIDMCTIETISFQRNLKYALEKRCVDDGLFFPYFALPAGYNSAGKDTSDLKIRGLAPLYATNKIRFRKGDSDTMELLDQLWRFPKGSYDDRIDSLAQNLHLPIFPSKVWKESEKIVKPNSHLDRYGRKKDTSQSSIYL